VRGFFNGERAHEQEPAAFAGCAGRIGIGGGVFRFHILLGMARTFGDINDGFEAALRAGSYGADLGSIVKE
jgi:hypothetical protein